MIVLRLIGQKDSPKGSHNFTLLLNVFMFGWYLEEVLMRRNCEPLSAGLSHIDLGGIMPLTIDVNLQVGKGLTSHSHLPQQLGVGDFYLHMS